MCVYTYVSLHTKMFVTQLLLHLPPDFHEIKIFIIPYYGSNKLTKKFRNPGRNQTFYNIYYIGPRDFERLCELYLLPSVFGKRFDA